MKMDVSALLDGVRNSLVVRETVDLASVRLRGVAPFTTPVSVTAQCVIRDSVVSLDCDYGFSLNLVCDRCLLPFTKEITQRSSHVVVRALSGPDNGEFIVAPDGIVRLDELATNDIIPELPSKILCRDDCKGLCPVCGQNRNQAECGCSVKETDPRLAILKTLFEN